jgi:hypothetical protein
MAIWEARLAELRERNDNPLKAEETAHIRGRIEELKLNIAQSVDLERAAARENEIEPGDVSALY